MGFFILNSNILTWVPYFSQNIFTMLKKILVALSLFIILLSCNSGSKSELQSTEATDTTSYITNDTIPNYRKTINHEAAASFSKNVPDEFNKWVFQVDVYETKETFKYLMRIKYKELVVTDSLRLPNFGITPKIILKSGKEPLSCIIGFADKKDDFKEYRKVFIDNNRLRMVSLKSYFVGVYQTKKQ